MDEPTSALDVVAQRSLMVQIKELQQRLGLRGRLRHPRHVAGQPLLRPAGGHVRRRRSSRSGATRAVFDKPAHPTRRGCSTPSRRSAGRGCRSPASPGARPTCCTRRPAAGSRPRCPHASTLLRRSARACYERRRARSPPATCTHRHRGGGADDQARHRHGVPRRATPLLEARGLTRHFKVGGALARKTPARRRRRQLHHRRPARSSRSSARAAAARAPSPGCWPASTSRRRARSTTRAGR